MHLRRLITSTPAASGGFPAELKTGLVEWWQLDQASGNETGAVAGTVLTDFNTVGSTTGLGGQVTARNFVSASNEFLGQGSQNITDNAGGDITVAARVNLTSKGASSWAYIYEYAVPGTNNDYVWLAVTPGESWWFGYERNGVLLQQCNTDAIVTTPTGPISVVATMRNGVSNAIWINGVSQTLLSDITTGGGSAFTGDLVIGSQVPGKSWNGPIQEVGVWHRYFTQSDVDLYHNGGNALVYS